ncbi:hypothetical protein ACFFJT_13120 [Dyella flava]|uniref:Uncharacterized protein n=1 Tax=Dyella flava TaxID=1920170 RepID=A0ABS2JZS6_9GAMM|nr:hypothetical protein [Dyella flava]MBM7124396.1 hypothetical protein [Dyella flava]GLQ52482.1 hypothetical protein GCM10010872_39310 [Dyella flava]
MSKGDFYMKSKRAVLAISLAFGLSGAAWAGAPSTGLGQAWPNATDVSLSPHYHVYVFAKDGIEYVQVNGLNGTVRSAIATANGTVLALPIGTDAAHVTTMKTNTATSAGTETVYQDQAVTVTATPASNGALNVTASPLLDTCTDPGECGDVVKQIQ